MTTSGFLILLISAMSCCAAPNLENEKSCGHPGDTPFGAFDLREGYEFVFGAVVEYTCDDGYQMVSKHKIRICAADGWTNETPHCEARLCPPVRDDSIRVLSYVTDDEYSMGHVITLQCKNPNDKLKGPSQIHCTANGTWNMDPPTCKVSPHCGKPPQIPHGEIITSMRDVYRSGSSVKYNCPHLFTLRGRKWIKCQSGIWEDPPICLEPCTTSDKNMNENHIMLSWKQNHKKLCIKDDQKKNQAKKCYIKHDETILFACLPEYKISDPKDLISKCNRGILPYPRCFQRN